MSDAYEIFKARLESLRTSYARELRHIVDTIASDWAQLRERPSQGDFGSLRRRLHSLAGSGATFGFSPVSATARQLDEALREILDDDKLPTLPRIRAIDGVMRDLQSAAEQPATPLKNTLVRSHYARSFAADEPRANGPILVVDDMHLYAQEIALQLGYHGFNVRTVSSLDNLHEVVRQADPAAILMDISFPEGDLAGVDAVTRLHHELDHLPPVIFLSQRHDLGARLAAAKASGDAYFTKPVDLVALTDKLETIAISKQEPPAPYRVMIVDDDAQVAASIACALEGAGMETRVLTDPFAILEPLADFRPELILMDLYMPACTGLELAAVIRQQETYMGTPIVFLSAETDISKHLRALSVGGDDFLIKPIELSYLVVSVRARVQRARVVSALMTRDSLTGLRNHTNLQDQLVREVARAERSNGVLAYAMLDLDFFKSVNDTHGHSAGDRVLRSLARLLRQRLRRTDIIGRYGGEEFALVLPDTDAMGAASILDEIRKDFASMAHYTAEECFSVTLSAGVASYPRLASVEALQESADQALYRAKQDGRNQVVPAIGSM